ncbi:hypothetical protein CORT_0D05710 [Candida orthopsilosis Co 90-125]|uniref:Uncharacterized protein n=1 Tax=Candida orthopsilosis (strain 90-125) TaxID=1136231 RepID=H8X5F3_CANO9|nr:hypothetical protein CORT_0D05710 [Candida orthopsilosis Co 90-125]CCG23409.1 hypothetical protein CORT_0D05710 [Candida orthopsilosis Co 90-125]
MRSTYAKKLNTSTMSSVESTERIELLSSSLERNLETFRSAHDLLNLSKDLLQNDNIPDQANIRLTKRNYIVDSFKLDKSHKEYKNWESETRLRFIKNDIVNYNQVVAKIAKANQKLNESSNTYETLAKTIQIPDFTVSIETLEKYGDEKLLELGKSYGIANLQLVQLFSLNADDETKLFPEFSIIQDLINIEFRLRVERRVHLEILMLMKNKMQSQNRTWTVKDNQLKEFLDIKVKQMIETVEQTNAEDNKEREDEEDNDDDDDDDDDEDEEGEVVREVDTDDGSDNDERETRNIEDVAKREHDGEGDKLDYEENIEEGSNAREGPDVGSHRELDAHMHETEANSRNSAPDDNSQSTKPSAESESGDDEMLIDH